MLNNPTINKNKQNKQYPNLLSTDSAEWLTGLRC